MSPLKKPPVFAKVPTAVQIAVVLVLESPIVDPGVGAQVLVSIPFLKKPLTDATSPRVVPSAMVLVSEALIAIARGGASLGPARADARTELLVLSASNYGVFLQLVLSWFDYGVFHC